MMGEGLSNWNFFPPAEVEGLECHSRQLWLGGIEICNSNAQVRDAV